VTVGNDHIFDQVQHFISSELIIAGTTDGRRTLGYDRAILVIHRWIREYTAREAALDHDTKVRRDRVAAWRREIRSLVLRG
jgi:hypothetical protein